MMSNPISEITSDPAHSEEEQEEEEEYVGMTKEEILRRARRTPCSRGVMLASVFDDGEEIKDDVKQTSKCSESMRMKWRIFKT